MGRTMADGRPIFRWYWLLRNPPLACILWILVAGSLFVLRDFRWFIAAVLLVLGYAGTAMYGRRVYKRPGANAVEPPKRFERFWFYLFVAQLVIGAVLLVVVSVRLVGWA